MLLNRLKYILVVSETGNFTKAAERLHISQPALSQSIRRFEIENNVLLFRRTRGKLTLTPAGECAVKAARQISDIENQLEADLTSLREAEKKTITLGAAVSYQRFFLTNVLNQMQNAVPDLRVDLQEGYSEGLSTLVQKGDLDYALMCEPFPQDLEVLPLFREEVFLAMAENHPLTKIFPQSPDPGYYYPCADLRQCEKYGFVSYSPNRRIQQLLQRETQAAGFSVKISTLCSSTEYANMLVSQGTWLAFIPAVTAYLCPENLRPRYYRLSPKGLYRTIGIVCSPDRKLSGIQGTFYNIVQNASELADNLDKRFFEPAGFDA